MGGFRETSQNFVGAEPITNAQEAFRTEGYELSSNGEVVPLLLDNLTGTELTEALQSYVRRAKRGALDAALVTGTGKDLIEATAAHVLTEHYGSYTGLNFPTLLGQAFSALGICAVRDQARKPQERLDAALYELACAVNALRNREGTGHGRPFLSSVTPSEARTAVEGMGIVAERLLDALKLDRP